MILTREDKKFIALTRYEERNIPKEAGFRWDSDNKYWYTNDLIIASKLYGYADNSCKAYLSSLSKKYDDNIAASKAIDSQIIIPANVGMSYHPFQKAGINFGITRDATLIADDMGLGKTIQAIGIANYKNEYDFAINSIIVVCPNAVKISWRDHFNEWLVNKKLSIGVANPKNFPASDVVIINYDLLKKYDRFIKKIIWDLAILDECHMIKNSKAMRTRYIIGQKERKVQIIEPLKSKIRLGLSGTPMLNKPIEIWPILNWLDPILWPDYFKFGLRYANGHKDRFGWRFDGYSNLKELQTKLRSTIMIRRMKSEVLTELPPKIREVVKMPVSDGKYDTLTSIIKEREEFDKWKEKLDEIRVKIELAKITDNTKEYQEQLSALRYTQSIAFTEMARVRKETALAKVPMFINHLKEILDTSEDSKVIIYAHHHEVIDRIAKEIPNSSILDGRLDENKKEAAKTKFIRDKKCRVLFLSIRAGGIGINGLQDVCSHGMFVEEDWVPQLMTQAEDRIFRMGQVRGVLIQHFVIDGSIDSLMAQKIVSKQKMADMALDKGLENGNSIELSDIGYDIPDITKDESVTPDIISIEADLLSKEQVNDIHTCLKHISDLCDGARAQDGMGFNKFDVRLGKSLSSMPSLTAKAAALGRKIVLKYRKQLDKSMYDSFERLCI